MPKIIFKDFNEYWYYAKYLTEYQRGIISESLPVEQQKYLNDSYEKGGWNDVFHRNEVDSILDDLKEKYGYDLLELKSKVLRNRSVYVPTKFWKVVKEVMDQYKFKDVKYAISGIHSIECKENPAVTLLISNNSKIQEN